MKRGCGDARSRRCLGSAAVCCCIRSLAVVALTAVLGSSSCNGSVLGHSGKTRECDILEPPALQLAPLTVPLMHRSRVTLVCSAATHCNTL